MLNVASRSEDVLGSGGIAPRILGLCTGWSEWTASRFNHEADSKVCYYIGINVAGFY